MSLKYGKILETVMIAILFCSLAFGQNNRPANVPPEQLPSRDIRHHITFTPQETFQALDDSNTTLIGRWANGPCYAVDVSGNIAYFGNGGYLEVVDISDPANPVELGKIVTPSIVYGVAVSGSYAYVADYWDGLRIIDVSTPSSPQEVGFFDTGGEAYGVAVSGSYAYVADYWDGLRIIDVSTPSSPQEVGFFDTGSMAYGVAVSGSYAYVADDWDGLRIIDVSTPSSPQEVGFFDTGGQAYGVAVSGSYAYVADYLDGLRIIDVSTPSSPQEVGFFDTAGQACGVAVSGSYAYVADRSDGLRIIDVSTPSSPQEVGFFDTGSSARGVAVSGSYAYVADHLDGLRIIDVSTPSSPQEVGFFDTGVYALGVAVSGSYAYVADHRDGLRIIDVSTPSSPQEVGFFDTGSFARGVAVSGSYAYVADHSDGLRIIDVSTLSSPQEVGFFDTGGDAVGVAVSGSYAYVADEEDGLRIIDVSTPSSPQEVGFFDTGGSALGVAVSGSYAYVADWDAGLRIIDVSTPSSPQEVGFFDTGSYARGVAVSGSYAYVADYWDGLRIIDVSTPSSPQEVGFFDTGSLAYGVAVSGSYAYVADYLDGLRIIDVSTPSSPQEVGFFDTGGEAFGVAVSGSYAYVADGEDGMYIIQNDLLISEIYLTIPIINAMPSDSVLVPVNVQFPIDSSFSSAGIIFGDYLGLLDFIEVDTTGSLIGAAGWAYQVNETDSLLITASAGAEDISGEGVLFRLKFAVPDTASGFIPITLISALFDESDLPIDITSGGVNVQFIPNYGDVSLNGEVTPYDASLILKYLVDYIDLNNQQLLNANVSLDTTVSALDASLILQYFVGLIDILPYDTTLGLLHASGDISMEDGEIQPGQLVQVPLYLSNGDNILAFEGLITFNPEHLTFDSLVWSELVDGFTIETDVDSGEIKVAGAGSLPDGQEGIFTTLHFTVNENFNENETTVTLQRLRWNEESVIEDVATATLGLLGISDNFSNIPSEYSLSQNYPNPFNPITTFKYALPKSSEVTLRIHNLLGQEVATLVDQTQEAGYHQVQWDATSIASGIYFYRLQAGEFSQTRKLILLK
ncbi:T9SS type A sorting domain-containing protein [candidate division KSB1 bacterium]|nr:T9SS type A sorting domain-containing protein [candidate division KSB1 bacterium]